MSDKDFFDDDDLMGQPSEPPQIPKKNIVDDSDAELEIDIPDLNTKMKLNDDEMRKIQKRDILSNNELYDTELGVNEKNIEVSYEKFVGESFTEEVPVIESPKKIVEELKKEDDEKKKQVYYFQQDESNPIPVKKSETGNVKNENNFSEDVSSNIVTNEDLDEDDSSKEYISRHDVISHEKRELERYNPDFIKKKDNNDNYYQYEDEDEEDIDNRAKNIFLTLFILLMIGISVFLFMQFKEENPQYEYNLSEEDLSILSEEYYFISDVITYLSQLNKLVDDEKVIIDEYISNNISKDDVISKLNELLVNKKDLNELYVSLEVNNREVVETKKIANEIFDNTILYTESLIESIINNDSSAKIVANFNKHVDENNSNIYMYNQYVMSVFKKRNIVITYDGTNFAIDTKWLQKN